MPLIKRKELLLMSDRIRGHQVARANGVQKRHTIVWNRMTRH